jgi:hypothetical protein
MYYFLLKFEIMVNQEKLLLKIKIGEIKLVVFLLLSVLFLTSCFSKQQEISEIPLVEETPKQESQKYVDEEYVEELFSS